MSILDSRLWLAAIMALALAFGGGRLVQSRADAKHYEAARTKAALSAALDQIKAADLARAEEQRRTAAQTEIANAATKEAESARADARDADAAAERLRIRVAQLIAAARAGNTAAAGTGSAAGDPLDVLANMFSRLDRRAGELAGYADSARIAGQACERSYDALTGGAKPGEGSQQLRQARPFG
ncbi:DUF2514 family protein [Cupriavidus necator]|uniref:DUF2514 family protein n=1 Tax=Cupriavidus necator TaxID=106590 RepID=UPI00068F7C87|nr:DUF2514 family protein [Cupriavidus necator]